MDLITFANMASKKMRGVGGLQTYYYLQTLLTGDSETGRKSPPKFNRRTL